MRIDLRTLRRLVREAFVGELAPIHRAIKDVYEILPEDGEVPVHDVFKQLLKSGKIPTRSAKDVRTLFSWFNRTLGDADPPDGFDDQTLRSIALYVKAFRSPTSIFSYNGYLGTLSRTKPDAKRLQKFRSETGGAYDVGMTTSQYRVMPRLYAERGGELAELIVMSVAELVSPEKPERIMTVSDALNFVNSSSGGEAFDRSSDADMMALHNALMFLSNPMKAPAKVRSALEDAGRNVQVRVEPIKSGGLDVSALANKIIVRWVGASGEKALSTLPTFPKIQQKKSEPLGISGRFTMSQYAPGPMPSGITARPKGGKIRKGPTGE